VKPTPILITVDAIVVVNDPDVDCSKILLVQRQNNPFKNKWCLPGGFVDPGETLEQAVIREVKEETNIDLFKPTLFDILDDVDRDPRGRTISFVFSEFLNSGALKMVQPGDDAKNASWAYLDHDTDFLGFDHSKVVQRFYKKQRRNLLPKKVSK
jgi:ADP-ribose pyrophosphatase YjhB (NUDIX family)